jgi:hypothetical protein
MDENLDLSLQVPFPRDLDQQPITLLQEALSRGPSERGAA